MAIFSDIHGNQEALEAFIAHSSELDVDQYMCLGDIVGYGANPNECIAMLRSLPDIRCVLGNHDAAAAEETSPYDMNRDAARAILWTMETLSRENIDFLKSMSATMKMGNMLFCHANTYRPLEWYYVNTREYAARSFARTKEKLLFIGHTHVSSIITRKNIFSILFESPRENSAVPENESKRQIINCGSIGQPRDGDPRLSYIIYDAQEKSIEFYRVDYDFEKAAEKIKSAGLPVSLALRLLKGV
ncbi:metallophosphoesterase family protein [Desulfobacterales bacterium HSG2]|nr:metallophosphoesterase family protein [Desulfobacterales bacterium HSG2]